MELQERLKALAEPEYAAFQAKLIPTEDREKVLGVRVPALRKLAKEAVRAGEHAAFLEALPHKYYDENMLHGLLVAELRDYDECIRQLDRFLPCVDNWAVCDTIKPRCFSKNKARLLEKIREWAASGEVYTARFGMEMLMTHFLDGDFRPEYLEIPAGVRLQDYYAKMMVAWFFATALAKQWEATVPYLEQGRLEPWIHNKTIQKARESFRITAEQKAYLRTLKKTAG